VLFLYFLVYVHICNVSYPCGVTVNDDEYSRPMKQTDRQTDRHTVQRGNPTCCYDFITSLPLPPCASSHSRLCRCFRFCLYLRLCCCVFLFCGRFSMNEGFTQSWRHPPVFERTRTRPTSHPIVYMRSFHRDCKKFGSGELTARRTSWSVGRSGG